MKLSRPLLIKRGMILLSMLLALLLARPLTCRAISPQFIGGSVLSAANNAVIPGAVVTTTTGYTLHISNGLFSDRLPPNLIDLIASAPGFRSNMATGILAGPGQTATVTIRLSPASAISGTLRGRVVETSSEGISGALVVTDLGAIAVTDNDGDFTAVGPSGTATVTVAARGYSSKSVSAVSIPGAFITVRLAHSFDGFNGPVSVSVRDACTGQQLPGIYVTTSSGKSLLTTKDRFTFSAPPGRTMVTACGEGYQCGFATLTRGFLPFRTDLTIALVPLNRGIGVVTGHITDSAGAQPIAGARVSTDTQDLTFTDAAGQYLINVSPCASALTVAKKGYIPYSGAVSAAAGLTIERDIDLEPLAGCIATGTIKSLFTGLPVQGASVQSDSDSTVSDLAGTYSVSLPACTSTIRVCADGYFNASRGVFAPEPDMINADIRLIPCPSCACGATASQSGAETSACR